MDAVSAIILEKDFNALGVNAIAQKAGISKVLIYRYFGSYDELLKKWAIKSHFWSEPEQTDHDFSEKNLIKAKEIVTDIFIRQIRMMRNNPILRKLIRWHISSESPLSASIMAEVEAEGRKLSDNFRKNFSTDLELEGMTALIIGGIYYLGIISDRVDVFNGVSLNDLDSENRLELAVCEWTDIIFKCLKP